MIFNWRTALAEWATPNGTPIPHLRIKGACEAIVAQTQADLSVLVEKLRRGEITWAIFEQEFRRAIDRNEIANAALAHGGFDKLTPKILERVGEGAAKQYGFLNKFVRDGAAGRLTPAQVGARATNYSNQGRATYENEYSEAKKGAGFAQAARILGANDHCPGCIEEAAKGWVPIDESLPIGDADCRTNCRCIKVYRLGPESPSASSVDRAIETANTQLVALRQLQAQKKTIE